MKRKVFIVIVLCLILSAVLMACAKPKELEHRNVTSGPNDDRVQTLLLTDIRFDGTPADTVREKMIKKMVEDKKDTMPYEFIAIAGNIVNCKNNGEVMKKAAKFLDSLQIPWATSIGELDVKGDNSKEEIIDILTSEELKYSLVMRGANYENNYYIQMLKENGELLNIMYFLDTSVPCDDGLIKWYENSLKSISYKHSEKQGEMIKSHIILNRALPMVKEYAAYEDTTVVSLWENGDKLQDSIVKLASTKSVLFGYDTANDFKASNIEDCCWGYIRSMGFDSAMGKSGDKERDKAFEHQAEYKNGANEFLFGSQGYVYPSILPCNPKEFIE